MFAFLENSSSCHVLGSCLLWLHHLGSPTLWLQAQLGQWGTAAGDRDRGENPVLSLLS